MTEKTCKVGDMVAWADVPDGAMVRFDGKGRTEYYARVEGRGWCVRIPEWPDWRAFGDFGEWMAPQAYRMPGWLWSGVARQNEYRPRTRAERRVSSNRGTIVALGLTGQESAADLQRLAEVFEVRDRCFARNQPWGWRDLFVIWMRGDGDAIQTEDAVALIKGGTHPLREVGRLTEESGDLLRARARAAERLHAAGWRPGMTADDAARLLAEKGA